MKKGSKITLESRKKMSKARIGVEPWNKGSHIYCGGGFNKGFIPWNKETKGVMKAWNKGKKISYIPHFGQRGKLIGKNNPNWKNGSTKERILLMGRWEYKTWRTSVFVRDDYVCQVCFRRGGNLEAHHIKPFAYYHELRFTIDNGRTLCVECHKTTKTYLVRNLITD